MLIGLPAEMSPDLLHCLARMGHGDEIVIADANYPAASTAKSCVVTDPIILAGHNAPQTVDLITQVMPLDGFTDYAALRMEIDNAPSELGDVHTEVWSVLTPRLPDGAKLSSIERQDFYVQARKTFAVVHCSEARAFGCFILRKGVVF